MPPVLISPMETFLILNKVPVGTTVAYENGEKRTWHINKPLPEGGVCYVIIMNILYAAVNAGTSPEDVWL